MIYKIKTSLRIKQFTLILFFSFSLIVPTQTNAGVCLLSGSDDRGSCARICLNAGYEEDEIGKCSDSEYNYVPSGGCPRQCDQYSPVSSGGLLPVPGASCDNIEENEDRDLCRRSLCPRICQKGGIGLDDVCTEEEDYKYYYCNYGVCVFENKNVGPNDPLLFAPGAIPCNYTLDDLVQTGINLANIFFGISGSLMLMFILYGGYQLMTTAGKTEHIEEGKKTLTAAFVGIILILGATVIVRFVGGLLGSDFGEPIHLGKTGFCVQGSVCPEGTTSGTQSPGSNTCPGAQKYCIPK